jgi:hypothetical protein
MSSASSLNAPRMPSGSVMGCMLSAGADCPAGEVSGSSYLIDVSSNLPDTLLHFDVVGLIGGTSAASIFKEDSPGAVSVFAGNPNNRPRSFSYLQINPRWTAGQQVEMEYQCVYGAIGTGAPVTTDIITGPGPPSRWKGARRLEPLLT